MAYYLKEQYDLLAVNETFRKRVFMGFFTVAREILSAEPNGNDTLQRNFARSIIMENDVSKNGFVAAVATDPDIVAQAVAGYIQNNPDSAQAAVTNESILAAIRKAWNILSGAST